MSEIENKKEPIRLFKSDFLEFFSHIRPWVVLVFFVPIILVFASVGIIQIVQSEASALIIPLGMLIGWFLWTFAEYVIHRFIFHYHPRTERMKRFFFTFHGVHHAQPMCRTRLVMPPIISVPIGVVFVSLYWLVFVVLLKQPLWVAPVFSGTAIGYVCYDMVHYSLHHSKFKKGYLAMCRRQHMRHHVTCPNMRYGISIPLWDYLFGTMPESGLRASLQNKKPAKAKDTSNDEASPPDNTFRPVR